MNAENAAKLKELLDKKPPIGKIIKTCVAGSHAYGLHNDKSDLDVRGIFMLPNQEFYGITEPKLEWEVEGYDAKWYEVGKFIKLLTKGNPTAIELLYTSPLYYTKEAQHIYDNRFLFLAKKPILAAYTGFAKSEVLSAAKDERDDKRHKRFSHVIRLMHQCAVLLSSGVLPVRLNEAALKTVSEIKQGKRSAEKVLEMYSLLKGILEKAAEDNHWMQGEVDIKKVNAFLIKLRRDTL